MDYMTDKIKHRWDERRIKIVPDPNPPREAKQTNKEFRVWRARGRRQRQRVTKSNLTAVSGGPSSIRHATSVHPSPSPSPPTDCRLANIQGGRWLPCRRRIDRRISIRWSMLMMWEELEDTDMLCMRARWGHKNRTCGCHAAAHQFGHGKLISIDGE